MSHAAEKLVGHEDSQHQNNYFFKNWERNSSKCLLKAIPSEVCLRALSLGVWHGKSTSKDLGERLYRTFENVYPEQGIRETVFGAWIYSWQVIKLLSLTFFVYEKRILPLYLPPAVGWRWEASKWKLRKALCKYTGRTALRDRRSRRGKDPACPCSNAFYLFFSPWAWKLVAEKHKS